MVGNDESKINEMLIKRLEKDREIDEELLANLKLRVWDKINTFAKEKEKEKVVKNNIENFLPIINSIDAYLTELDKRYTWKLNQIVEEEICAKCGTCSIVCPNELIVFDTEPHIHEECIRCGNGMCYDVCPRINAGSYQILNKINPFEEFYYTQEYDGKNNEIINHILEQLIENNEIDGAIFVGNYKWKPVSMIVTDKDGIKDSTKSQYAISTLEAINEAGELGLERIAVVGLPCQIAGLRNVQLYKEKTGKSAEKGEYDQIRKIPKIEYLIGVFCKAKYEHKETVEALKKRNIEVTDIQKFETVNNNLKITLKDKEVEINLEELNPTPGCQLCRDYDAKLSDVSIGNKGSDKDSTTIIIRTKKGEKIKEFLNLKKGVDLKQIHKMRQYKEDRYQKRLKEKQENNQYISYYDIYQYPGVIPASNDKINIKLPGSIAGYYKPETVIKLAEIAKKYNGLMKLTVREDFHIENINPEDVEYLYTDLEDEKVIKNYETPITNPIITCPGDEFCKRGTINSRKLAKKIDDIITEEQAPFKFKSIINACAYRCLRPSICEFGINTLKKPEINDNCLGCGVCEEVCIRHTIKIEDKKAVMDEDKCVGCADCIRECPNDAKDIIFEGYDVFIGGKSGSTLIEGNHIQIEDEEDLLNTLKGVLIASRKYTKDNNKKRLHQIIKEVGFENFMNDVENIKIEQ